MNGYNHCGRPKVQKTRGWRCTRRTMHDGPCALVPNPLRALILWVKR